jgi:hypothetical protein
MAAVLMLGMTGCNSEPEGGQRVPGCTVPPNEAALLTEYAKDPVLAVTPEGASRVGGLVRSKACERLSREDVSNTSVMLQWRLSRDYDEASLRRLYDPVASGSGWRSDRDGGPPLLAPGDVYVTYCRRVNGVVSRLTINAQAAQWVDSRPSTGDRPASPSWAVINPGGIYITISADPARPACPSG